MNFLAYKELAKGILASERGSRLLRLDCMNPVKALAAMRPCPPTRPSRSSIQDLRTSWRERWGLTDMEGRVVLSTGVRPLLARLLHAFARERRLLHAPEDVYPVYLELAEQAGVTLKTFQTVPGPILPALQVGQRLEVMLIPEPLVPLGRGLNEGEATMLSSWLDEDDKRLLVLDCVYTFGSRFTEAAEMLLGGGRTVLLHSLAKSFLTPNVAGFAIGPRSVMHALEDEISDEACGTAVQILHEAPALPQRLAREFARRWSALNRATGLSVPATGYFEVLPMAFDELLARGQLTVPGSVFGARSENWSAATCLLADDLPVLGRVAEPGSRAPGD